MLALLSDFDNAQLFIEKQVVCDVPIFGKFAINDTIDVHPLRCDLLAGCCDTHKLALMSSFITYPNPHFITFGYDVVNGFMPRDSPNLFETTGINNRTPCKLA